MVSGGLITILVINPRSSRSNAGMNSCGKRKCSVVKRQVTDSSFSFGRAERRVDKV